MRRRYWVPEVLQSSLMDCGPAALKALLEGFGIEADYDGLRDRCATDVDGTSIDDLAALGQDFGLQSHEILVARDTFLLPEARCLPAIVVTRSAGGLLHFIIVWRTLGPWVMVMDPASGRRWLSRRQLLATMPEIPIAISTTRYRKWAESRDALRPLLARLAKLGVRRAQAATLVDLARADRSWRSFATLDAAIRMLTALVAGRAVRRGVEAFRLLASVARPTLADDGIPAHFRWVTREGAPPGKLLAHGSVIVHFTRRLVGGGVGHEPVVERGAADADAARPAAQGCDAESLGTPRPGPRPSESERLTPLRVFWRMLRADCPGAVLAVALASSLVSLVVLAEAVLMRGLIDVELHLVQPYQRAFALAALLSLVLAALGLELWIARAVGRLGRGLEIRLRAAFASKLPLLPDRYLQSRPSSDLTERGHLLHAVRQVPVLWARGARAGMALLTTTGGVLWLYPEGTAWVLGLAASAIAVPLALRYALAEGYSRLRTHASGLQRFYLDALLGASPVRVHGAERAVRVEHEQMLTDWARTARSVHARSSALHALQLLSSTGLGLVLVGSYVLGAGAPAKLLLLAFWSLRIPLQASELALTQLALRGLAPLAARLVAPLQTPSGEGCAALPEVRSGEIRRAPPPGCALSFDDVSVCAGGHTLLEGLSCELPAGSHVAIVGESGAGKSSLLGLLLGWLEPTRGRLRIDGRPLDQKRLAALRAETAWLDPAVQLWEGSLYDNLVYGDDSEPQRTFLAAMSNADLVDVLEHLPEGMQANLGEGGARVSGGQGQRVRLGRALMRSAARLVILDEPFRGLERERRRELLRRARAHWRGATLLFVSHDIEDTTELDRVLVLHAGRIVEDASPALLMANGTSRYSLLLQAARAAHSELWAAKHWRRASIARGALRHAGES